MVLFNRLGLSPMALGGAGIDTVFRAAEDMAAQFNGQAASTGYGELTRATARTTESGVTLEVIVPGFGPDDVELTVKRDLVAIRGARGGDGESRPTDSFTKTWRVGFPIDADRVQARVERGILTIELPRHASESPRTIAIDGQSRATIDGADDAGQDADRDPEQ